MIASLKGTLESIDKDSVVIDCNGVGYQVFVSGSTIAYLPDVGAHVHLFIEHIIKSEVNQLVGFLDIQEKRCFKMLLAVPGVGTKMALSILSIFPHNELFDVIGQGNVSLITKVPGVGKKIAERVIIELRSKGAPMGGQYGDVFLALLELGYTREQSIQYIEKAKKTIPDGSTQDLLRQALSEARKI